ncbi:MAG: DNA polymerase/3'-5' exonuclease PolX [Elusimicrobia bacterium]|nr:DNA polymerase/3'-5' exonuclease PolX [Elusimicrobiota bacterium]
MDNKEVAAVLEEISALLELKGENPFKCRAYANAARTIAGLSTQVSTLVKTGQLVEIKGIGEGLSEKITELVTRGQLPYYEELKKSFPAGVQDMLRVQGLGPKRVKVLYEELGIKTLPALETACRKNRLLGLAGFGTKMQENILNGLQYLKRHQDHFLYDQAFEEAQAIATALKQHPDVIRLIVAGSLRRHKEIIKDIDLVVSARRTEGVMETFSRLPDVEAVAAKGDTKSSVALRSGIRVDLRVVNDKEFPYALHYFTGSAEHNTALRSRAKTFNYKLNEYGLFRGDRLIPCTDEAEIFKALKLAYIPPELREDQGEIEAAERGTLPRLIEDGDIRGVFHVHSTWSDGKAPLKDMIEMATRLGFEYVGISDHSKSAAYAGGLKDDQVKQQQKELDQLQRQFPQITILKGIESDILTDGALDYPERILAGFDFVIASIHSRFTMSETEMTKRVITAIKNKHTTMFGHPTGRLLLEREGYQVNIPEVLKVAADHGVVVELNANPHRFDLDWRWGQLAKKLGVKISINPDAHSTEGLKDVRYGVGIARKAWFTASDVINTLPVAKMVKFLQARKLR